VVELCFDAMHRGREAVLSIAATLIAALHLPTPF
jgi:hypothetical protein